MYRYLFDAEVEPSIQAQRRQLRAQVAAIAQAVPALAPLTEIWEDYDPDFFQAAAANARTWVADQIITVTAAYERAIAANPNNPPRNAARVRHELQLLYDELHYIKTFDKP